MKKFIKKLLFFVKIIFNNKLYFKLAKSQNKNEESSFLKKISSKLKHKYFIEIGFHNTEFNTIGLIEKNFSGLLIDGGRFVNILTMKFILKILGKKNVKVKNFFVEKKNIKKIFKENKKIGCLSIDIDGNDFWIVKSILELNIRPEIFIVEYNPSFLNYSYSVPYDKNFNRFKKHSSGLYHGASLYAFSKLFKKNGYHLIKVIGGVNAIFINHLLCKKLGMYVLNHRNAYQEGLIRNKIHKKSAKEQFNEIKNLDYVKF